MTFGDGRRYVLVGDAAYTRDAIDAGQPQGRPWNVELATAALARLKALEESGATLLLAHDREQWSDVSDVADVRGLTPPPRSAAGGTRRDVCAGPLQTGIRVRTSWV